MTCGVRKTTRAARLQPNCGMLADMTTWQSLLNCAAADVTLDRIRALIGVTGTESLTVEFKKDGNTLRIAESAAAMANTYGGLVLVGISDGDREIAGVPREVIANVASTFATHLDPADWLPDMREVAIDDRPSMYVLVIRINRETAPRPIFVQRREGRTFWAPIRMPGGTRQATRDELRALFAEDSADRTAEQPWTLNAPDFPRTQDGGQDPSVDLMVLSGLRVPVGPKAAGRPISQRAVDQIAIGLDRSALARSLFELTGSQSIGVESFHREGPANRSHVANLVWRLGPGELVPFEVVVRLEVPGHYGQVQGGDLALTLKVTSRLTAWLRASLSVTPPPPQRRRLETREWAALLDSIALTLTCDEIADPVADLADVDSITIGQPRVLHIVSGPPMPDLLPPQLRPISGAGVSHGAHMQADPVLDLSDPADRAEQIDRWLFQIGADAGLVGMERLVTEIHAAAST
jgi:hypothetical protein